MTSVQNIRILSKCPWCGGGFTWGETTGKPGATTTVYCCSNGVGFRQDLKNFCEFRGLATRLPNGKIEITCTEEYYWQGRWKELQYELALKFHRRKCKE